jgi:hypothetical protein
MTFVQLGRSLEAKWGSLKLLAFMLQTALLVNVVFTAVCLALYYASGSPLVLLATSQGFWTILMTLITLDCHSPNSPPTRRLLFLPFQIPTVYYPIALLALFTLFSGVRVDMYTATAIGYAQVHGYFTQWEVTEQTLRGLEGGIFRNYVDSPGFVTVSNATGEDSLPTSNTATANSSSFATSSSASTTGGTRALPPPGGWALPGVVSPPSFPGGGQAVGSFGGVPIANRGDGNASREAMLKAAERRAASSGGNS